MNTTIQIRTNDKIKSKAQKVLKNKGLTLSFVLNQVLEEIADKKEFPLTIFPIDLNKSPIKNKWKSEMLEIVKKEKGYKSTKEIWSDNKKNIS
jgi:addiction module RelB/DinJ family antitoxin